MENVWLPLGTALLDWFAVSLNHERLQNFTKPAVMLATIGWFILDGPGLASPALLFLAALVCALVGDILLLPALDRFLPGLIAFFLAHLLFSAGLNIPLPPLNASTAVFAALVALLVFRVYGRVKSALAARKETWLQTPVRVYSVALSLTLFSGLATLANDAWSPSGALLAAFGVVLFALSDLILIWNRLISPIAKARLVTRVMYHLGLISLVAGALIHFK